MHPTHQSILISISSSAEHACTYWVVRAVISTETNFWHPLDRKYNRMEKQEQAHHHMSTETFTAAQVKFLLLCSSNKDDMERRNYVAWEELRDRVSSESTLICGNLLFSVSLAWNWQIWTSGKARTPANLYTFYLGALYLSTLVFSQYK